MTGILSFLREILQIYRPTESPHKLFWSCVIIAFILSAGILWFIEHQKVVNLTDLLKKEKPNFILSVYQLLVGDVGIKGTQVFINLGVKNLGTPSIAYGWHLNIKSSSINKDIPPTLIKDGEQIFVNGKLIAIFHQNNRLEEKTISPIQQNAYIGGWLKFDLPNINTEQFSEATKTIYFKDIFEHEYPFPIKEKGIPEELKYYPGSGDNPFVVDSLNGK